MVHIKNIKFFAFFSIILYGIYWAFFATRFYKIGYPLDNKYRYTEYYIISNPPEDRIELMNIVSGFINHNFKNKRTILKEKINDTKIINIMFFKESKEFNRFFNFYGFMNDWENYENAGLFDYNLNSFIISVENNPLKEYIHGLLNPNNDKTKYSTRVYDLYFPFGFNGDDSKHWVLFLEEKGKISVIDSTFIPPGHKINDRKYKYLKY
jgi:hypothetical protein